MNTIGGKFRIAYFFIMKIAYSMDLTIDLLTQRILYKLNKTILP